MWELNHAPNPAVQMFCLTGVTFCLVICRERYWAVLNVSMIFRSFYCTYLLWHPGWVMVSVSSAPFALENEMVDPGDP